MAILEHTVSYDELTQTWLGMVDGTFKFPGQTLQAQTTLRGIWSESHFVGATIPEMKDWIANGRVAPGMELAAGAPARPRQKHRFSDEDGELQVDLVLSGSDTPYLQRSPRKRQPGIRVQFELNARANTPARVLSDYAQWAAEVISALQARGADLEVDVTSRAKHVTKANDQVNLTVRVKRFGRQSSLKSWGAIFAPSGFRMLIFAGRMMAAEAHGKPVNESGGVGASFTPDWGVEFDAKTRTLKVSCAASSNRFPRERMTSELEALKF